MSKSKAAAKAAALQRNLEMVLTILESIDCARSLSLSILIRHGDWETAMSLPFQHEWFEDPTVHAAWWQAHRLLAKAEWLPLAIDKASVAISSFKEAENHCRVVNRRLRTQPLTGRVSDVFHRARGKIASLLGSIDYAISGVLDLAKWGGGASSSVKGSAFTERYNKIASTFDVTPSLFPLARHLQHEWPAAPTGEIRLVPGNRVTTVPKTYKTDRTIAVEPTVNAALQRGVGRILARKLRRWGIFTDDQTPNQRLARIGSASGRYATIDLSMASDTISQAVLELLIPSDWLALFESLRSRSYELDGVWYRYEKHSSMGNGYTFELETLVFAALILATYDVLGITSDYAVFGDDIVVDTDAVNLVDEVLSAGGFIVNREKSFSSGPFRESCGEEFFYGVRCTPYYSRKWSNGHDWTRSAMTLANWVRESPILKSRKKLWLQAFLSVPKKDRLKGPSSVDNVFHVNAWEVDPSLNILVRRPYGPWFGYRVRARRFVPLTQPLQGEAGVIESTLRCSEQTHLPGLPWLRISSPSVNTARGRGRWVQGFVIVDDWPAVLGL